MIACSACSLRGRPGRREVSAGPASVLLPGPLIQDHGLHGVVTPLVPRC